MTTNQKPLPFFTEWRQKERNFSQTPLPAQLPNFCSLPVDPELIHRKIYLFAQMQLTNNAADFYAQCKLNLRYKGKTLTVLPASIGIDTTNTLLTSSESLPNLFTYSQASTNPSSGDAIHVVLSAKFTSGDSAGQPDRVLLWPAIIQSNCDELLFEVESWKVQATHGNTGFRVFLGCLSSYHRQ